MNSSPLDRVSLKNPVHLLALGFGSGLIRPAPGTWGSLAGTILGSALLACIGLKIFLILTALCFNTNQFLVLPYFLIKRTYAKIANFLKYIEKIYREKIYATNPHYRLAI